MRYLFDSGILRHARHFSLVTTLQPSAGVPQLIANRSGQLKSVQPPSTVSSKPVKTTLSENIATPLIGELPKEPINGLLARFRMEWAPGGGSDEERPLFEVAEAFHKFCMTERNLPPYLYVRLQDIQNSYSQIEELLPAYCWFVEKHYPHLTCLTKLTELSNLSEPTNWYAVARNMRRKIIFHAGPTNSGKTHHAMQRLRSAKTGVYCAPLRLLAAEVYSKLNAAGTACDLLTGEEQQYAIDKRLPADHLACTVEKTPVDKLFEVAVIDEIQEIGDAQRGWAWTRALLGLAAEEIHVCGEAGSLSLLEKICATTNETVEVRNYERLTKLHIEQTALQSLRNIQPGDCIVCFSRRAAYNLQAQLTDRGKEVILIYGSLPPSIKQSQVAKFNDPENRESKVLVATDAIGMGLNLNIRRIIFYSLEKLNVTKDGERIKECLSVSRALQIAGRAGRYGTQWSDGYVTTYNSWDLPTLRKLLSAKPPPLQQAGLQPPFSKIEACMELLPKTPLSAIMEVFVSSCTIDESSYFICNLEGFKLVADMIEHIPLSLQDRYTFCCAPISKSISFACTMFLRMVLQYSYDLPITYDFVSKYCRLPLRLAKTEDEQQHLEAVFHTLELYLWLSNYLPDHFPDAKAVTDAKIELAATIEESVKHFSNTPQNVIIPMNVWTES